VTSERDVERLLPEAEKKFALVVESCVRELVETGHAQIHLPDFDLSAEINREGLRRTRYLLTFGSAKGSGTTFNSRTRLPKTNANADAESIRLRILVDLTYALED